MYEWVKRLGQQHWSKGNGKTLCGMPMLGNNYAQHLPESEKVPCPKCSEIKNNK